MRKGILQSFKNPGIVRILLKGYLLDKKRIEGIITDNLKTGPENVSIGVSACCNYQCLFCRFHSKIAGDIKNNKSFRGTFMDLKTYFKILDCLRDTISIYLTGYGEPLLNPDILKMVSYAKERGILTCITTNGSLLTPELIKKLANAGLNGISISLNAGTNETYMKLHPTAKPDTFGKIKENIKLLSKYNIIVRVSFVLNKMNCTEVEEIIKTVINLNVDLVDFLPVRTVKGLEYLEINKWEQIKLNKRLAQNSRRLKKKNISNNINMYLKYYSLNTKNILMENKCYFPYISCYILENGIVYPCCNCNYNLGNVNNVSFEKIWFSKQYNLFRSKILNKNRLGNLAIKCGCDKCILVKMVIKTSARVQHKINKKNAKKFKQV